MSTPNNPHSKLNGDETKPEVTPTEATPMTEAPFDPLKTIRPLDGVLNDQAELYRDRQRLVKDRLARQQAASREQAARTMLFADADDATKEAERTASKARGKEMTRKVFMAHIEKAQSLIQLLKDQKKMGPTEEVTAKIGEALGNPTDATRATRRINNTLMQGLTALEILYRKYLIDFKNSESNFRPFMRLVTQCKELNYGTGRKRVHLMNEEEIATLDYLLRNIISKE